ncbi:sugar ABC transporter ATP-binding protein [Neobacillus sp. NPDC093182]|uniref:sugar ABC transporter ATP-binding protein n=1 Tax=Neobacillus sp. NPDC093182 TaxID=3364297 RepID=UPI00383097CA
MRRVLLSAKEIDKSYGTTKVLENVSFELYENEILGLVGENGAGKSTLLKILSGVISPDSGQIQCEGETVKFSNTLDATNHGVGMVFQEQNLIPTIPVFENMFLGRQPTRVLDNKKIMINKCKEVFEMLGIDVDPTVLTGNLPIGIRQFLEIGKAFMQTKVINGRRVILLDEPSEALSKNQLELFMNIIKNNKSHTSFIFVSHRLNETIELCDRLIAMKDGKVVTSMSVTQETTEDDLHQLMVGRKRDSEFYQENLQRTPNEEVVLSLKNVTLKGVFENISLDLKEGEIIGLAGMLGSGRSELSRVMAGVIKPESGKVFFLQRDTSKDTLPQMIKKGMCFVPPERKEEGVILPHSVNWNFSLVTPFVYKSSRILNLAGERERTGEYIKKIGVKTKSIETLTENLSGGNQQKIVIGKWLIRNDIRVVVVEEPTRGIDVGAKQEIYKLFRELTNNGVSIVVSTENLLELIGLCNRIFAMKDGEIKAVVKAPPDNKPHEVDIVKHMV